MMSVAVVPCEQQRQSSPYNDKCGWGYMCSENGTADEEEL
jgi:hypothetical protein